MQNFLSFYAAKLVRRHKITLPTTPPFQQKSRRLHQCRSQRDYSGLILHFCRQTATAAASGCRPRCSGHPRR